MQLKSTFLQLCRFGMVGVMAAALHYWVVIALVEWCRLPALQANLFGFASAFGVSYWGHTHWTFAHQRMTFQSFLRFLRVALLGFACNQLLFFLLLKYSALPYFIVLAIVLVIVAVMTYILSRYWAFHA